MVLEKVNTPEDLSSLTDEELKRLCQELRQLITEVTLQNGGHLASNLGVVELTVALHRSFDFKKDVLIWDVGHQCYAHKILTGRKDRFHTIRTYGGLSGFTKKEESIYDHFGAGHSSTSISAALGFAKARDLKGQSHHVVAVIGDGALLNGLAMEALNNIDIVKSKVIIILNDNNMSISPRVGGFAKLLARLSSSHTYLGLKRITKDALKRIPHGKAIVDAISKIKSSIKHILLPTSFFEDIGISYWGPFDGHNIEDLEKIFNLAKDYPKSVLIHVLTKKGCGYKKAEQNPTKYHGVSGNNTKKVKSWSKAFGEIAVKLAEKDERIVALTAAMADGTGLTEFAKRFPDRFFDVGIAEGHMLTFAAGMACCGLKPIVAIYSTFLQRAYDQLIHDIALQKLPVILAVDRAGVVGEDGPTHHGTFDIAYMLPIPEFILAAPKDEQTLHKMLKLAINTDKPFLIRYPRGNIENIFPSSNEENILPGKAKILSEGEKITIFAYGSMVTESFKAVSKLYKEHKKRINLIDLQFAKPIDKQTILNFANQSEIVITIEEGVLTGGIGSLINQILTKNNIKRCKVINLGIPDEFITHGSREELLKALNLDSESIYSLLKGLI